MDETYLEMLSSVMSSYRILVTVPVSPSMVLMRIPIGRLVKLQDSP